MLALVVIAVWLLCASVAYRMIRWWWLDALDWTRSDARSIGAFLLVVGPLGLVSASVLCLSTGSGRGDEVIAKRREVA